MVEQNFSVDPSGWQETVQQWMARCHFDDVGLRIRVRERVVLNVRSRTDPMFGVRGTVTKLVGGAEPSAVVAWSNGDATLVPRRALRSTGDRN